MKNHSLNQLLDERKLWRGQQLRPRMAASDSCCTGFKALDAALHSGGWPRSGSTELLGEYGIGELWLLMPTLRERSAARPICWLNPPYLPYPPALAQQGIAANRQLLVRPKNVNDQLWAAEELLRSGAYAAVLTWFAKTNLNDRQLRRLHIAALEGECWHLHFRPAALAQQISPAPLRLQLHTAKQALDIQIMKQQGGHAGQQLQLARPAALYLQQSPASNWPVYTTAPASNLPVQRQLKGKISLLNASILNTPARPAKQLDSVSKEQAH
ncbi:translesion DNA synthesis-associated protein ImuA [Zhongshania aquimaris]|uniref:Translesion DNA synthesis-associated protein ImuA n=1 Tax=Zhongshania aquimaris TaxID=2857107 RepID=A0ABS6VUK6_9GAMM|nr:translesion DNA synthesis-associated protein ImuA [Zhongshania aquimaris]MBW2941986.1 translesion DNA synthesis-associated protein ImuA [Zhongshania aquimaris]